MRMSEVNEQVEYALKRSAYGPPVRCVVLAIEPVVVRGYNGHPRTLRVARVRLLDKAMFYQFPGMPRALASDERYVRGTELRHTWAEEVDRKRAFAQRLEWMARERVEARERFEGLLTRVAQCGLPTFPIITHSPVHEKRDLVSMDMDTLEALLVAIEGARP